MKAIPFKFWFIVQHTGIHSNLTRYILLKIGPKKISFFIQEANSGALASTEWSWNTLNVKYWISKLKSDSRRIFVIIHEEYAQNSQSFILKTAAFNFCGLFFSSASLMFDWWWNQITCYILFRTVAGLMDMFHNKDSQKI